MADAVNLITKLKDSGNVKFGNDQFVEAIHDYSIALQLSESTYKQQKEVAIIDLMSLIYSNRSQCNIQLKQYQKGITNCNESILLSTSNKNTNHSKLWKAYYRRGICYESLNELKNALSDLQNANKLWLKYNTKKGKNKSHHKKHKSNRNQTIHAAITRITAQLKGNEDPQSSFLNDNVFEKQHATALINNGYVVIDNIFRLDIANAVLFELQSMINLQNPSYLKPNVTYFKNKTNQIIPFSKPHIWELDLHSIFDDEQSNASNNKTIQKLKHKERFNKLYHIFSSNVLSDVIERRLNEVEGNTKWDLNKGKGKYAIKLQWNEGSNGCFPWHIDNPSNNKRRITMVFYLNKEWKEGDGGEIVLLPFMNQQIVVPPVFNRCVVFLSELMLHRVLPANKTRYCFSVWMDKADYAADIDELFEEKKSDDNEDAQLGAVLVNKDMKWLKKPSVQCTLSRWIYDEEYVESLKDCIVDLESVVYKQLYSMHSDHIETLQQANKDTGVVQIVQWLKKNKPTQTLYWDSM
eukprot:110336_1